MIVVLLQLGVRFGWVSVHLTGVIIAEKVTLWTGLRTLCEKVDCVSWI